MSTRFGMTYAGNDQCNTEHFVSLVNPKIFATEAVSYLLITSLYFCTQTTLLYTALEPRLFQLIKVHLVFFYGAV